MHKCITIYIWTRKKFGVWLGGWEKPITHTVYADNIWLFAVSTAQMQEMNQDLTDAVYAASTGSKESSLEILVPPGQLRAEHSTMTPHGTILKYRMVVEMEVLGSMINYQGSTAISVAHRLAKTEGTFWANAKTLKSPGKVASNLSAWSSGPSASALLGADSWVLSKMLLQMLRRWELRWLRKSFRMRRRQDEGNCAYNRRTPRLLGGLPNTVSGCYITA